MLTKGDVVRNFFTAVNILLSKMAALSASCPWEHPAPTSGNNGQRPPILGNEPPQSPRKLPFFLFVFATSECLWQYIFRQMAHVLPLFLSKYQPRVSKDRTGGKVTFSTLIYVDINGTLIVAVSSDEKDDEGR